MTNRSRQINFLASHSDMVRLGECFENAARIFRRFNGVKGTEYASLDIALQKSRLLYFTPNKCFTENLIEFTGCNIQKEKMSPGRFYIHSDFKDECLNNLYNHISYCIKKSMEHREHFYYVGSEAKLLLSKGYKISLF